MSSSSAAPPPDISRVDPRIWQACAGTTVRIPTVNSRVYYFPQGHLEQSSSASTPILSPFVLCKPCIGCVISAVSFHADAVTDEVFARIVLHPVESLERFSPSDGQFNGGVLEEDKITSYAKTLTSSDANNGGGFSVPRYCADSIFPPLDFQDDPPVQTLVASDIHGVSWSFRHIYRGTPRRHLLTTGWSKFVNSKKLVAGDSVQFMKNSYGNMFLGIRRASRTSDAGDYAQWRMQVGAANVKVDEDFSASDGFSRNGRGRVPLESVVNAMEMAARDFPFEVIYYPRVGWSDFVVKADVVEAAMRIYWTPGLRVKMAMETDDSSRITWFQGTVSSASLSDKGSWQGSPWRTIQITWDEPEVLWNARYVNPWQVEVAMTHSAPPFPFMCPPTKRPRSASVRTDLRFDGEPKTHFPVYATTSTMGSTGTHSNKSSLKYNNTSPAGMQGARQDAYVASNFSHYFDENTPLNVFPSDMIGYKVPKLTPLSTGFNNGSPSENLLSPDSLSSGLSSAIELVSNREPDTPKVTRNSIKLFGEIIYVGSPIDDGSSDETCCAEEEGGGRETEEPMENNSMDLSLNGSYGKLLIEELEGA